MIVVLELLKLLFKFLLIKKILFKNWDFLRIGNTGGSSFKKQVLAFFVGLLL